MNENTLTTPYLISLKTSKYQYKAELKAISIEKIQWVNQNRIYAKKFITPA